MDTGSLREYFPLLVPLIVLQLVLTVAALLDLARRERVAGGAKWPWALVIIFVSTIGPLIYFAFGRKD
ncbi:MAG: PLD nuclease N-terminal domain-containing protein [Bacteroidota bacterium]